MRETRPRLPNLPALWLSFPFVLCSKCLFTRSHLGSFFPGWEYAPAAVGKRAVGLGAGRIWLLRGRAGEGVAAVGEGALAAGRRLRAAALASSRRPPALLHSGLLPELALPFSPLLLACEVLCSVQRCRGVFPGSALHIHSCFFSLQLSLRFLIMSCFCSMWYLFLSRKGMICHWPWSLQCCCSI